MKTDPNSASKSQIFRFRSRRPFACQSGYRLSGTAVVGTIATAVGGTIAAVVSSLAVVSGGSSWEVVLMGRAADVVSDTTGVVAAGAVAVVTSVVVSVVVSVVGGGRLQMSQFDVETSESEITQQTPGK